MDDAKKEQAIMLGQAFGGALVASLNLTATLMHGLVFKGLLTNEQARALLDDAAAASAKMKMPSVFAEGIRAAYAEIRKGFEG